MTWDDFQGTPDYRRGAAAITSVYIAYDFRGDIKDSTYLLTFNISNNFRPKSSWVKRASKNEYILSHEQLHFDIFELHTRELADTFKATIFTSNFKTEVDTIFKNVMDECFKMQSKYDNETAGSNNKNMQLKWQLFIYLELKKLPRNY